MNAWLASGLWNVLVFGAACAAADTGLPASKGGERAALESHGWIAGGALLTHDPIHAPPPEPADTLAPDLAQPTAEETVGADNPPNPLPEKFWSAYFRERPKSFLLDPQGLLESAQHHDRLGFLNDHAGDSSIDLFVYLFKGDQDLPGEVRAEECVERFFMKGRPDAVVFYFMGAPQRSIVYLSPPILERVPTVEQRRSLESSIMKALEKQGASGQLEAFLVQMSIRVYWMEQMMGGTAADGGPTALTERPARTTAKKPGLLTRLQPVLDQAKPLVMPAAALAGALAMLLGVAAVLRRRALHRFPEFEVEPRLGGAHAAGVGAVISFARSAPPPATQRDQTPDYLRRA